MKKSITILLSAIVMLAIGCTQETDYPCHVTGTVTSTETGLPLANCTVTVGGRSDATGSDGRFSIGLDTAPAAEKIAVLKQGYSDYRKLLADYSGNTINLELFLKPVDTIAPIDHTAGGTVRSVDGAQVDFPSLDGKVSEDLIVSLTSFDVSTDDMFAIPGGFESDQPDTLIYSTGMIDVDIRGAQTGSSYTLADSGLSFSIRIPISGIDPDTAPATIPMWYFNEETCLWTEEGVLTKNDGFYEGTVTHFTVWNADFKFSERTSICATINDFNGVYGNEFRITLSFSGFYRTYTQTAPDLDFSVINLPRNMPMRLTITAIETGARWERMFTSGNSDDCLALGTIPSDTEANFPEVFGLSWTKTDSTVTFTWTGESPAATGVEIECSKDDVLVSMQSIPSGSMQATFAGLETGAYEFEIVTIYPTGESAGIDLTLSVNMYYTLTIDITQPDDDPDYINMFYSYEIDGVYIGELRYSGPVRLPADCSVYLIPRDPEGDYIDQWMILWEGDVYCGEGCGVNMDSDKTIGCSVNDQPPT